MNQEQLYNLIERYAAGTATETEIRQLQDWYQSAHIEEVEWPAEDPGEKELVMERMRHRLQRSMRHGRVRHMNGWKWTAAAAAALLLAGGGWWTLKQSAAPSLAATVADTTRDIGPGGNHAVLTLSGGQTILLDDAANGVIGAEAGAQIRKKQDGQLAYEAAGDRAGATLTYNTLTTPRGGMYRLSLPDGTQVWLNSASSLRYPAAFSGNSRVVELSGEAYFDIAPDAGRPFKVMANGMEVQVLGTQFNVMTYNDEPLIRTSLLQGSVRLNAAGSHLLLAPGKEGVLLKKTQQLQPAKGNAAASVAWKDGYFLFDSMSMDAILRQIARWYDVDIEWQGGSHTDTFSGKISRQVPLSKLLQVLATGGMRFKVEGKKLIVQP